VFEERDRIRGEFCAAFLRGVGAEIGAGANPHPLPDVARSRHYDIRAESELQAIFGGTAVGGVAGMDDLWRDFPTGADFLIAHNVLEHVADPIGTLIGWHRAVRDGGTMVLSLPDKNACNDLRRLEPPFAHLIDDYLLDRGVHAFESREHILSDVLTAAADQRPVSAACGFWGRALARLRGRRSREVRRPEVTLATLFEPVTDLHWHAFTQSLAEKTVLAACELGGHSATLLAKADFTSTPVRTIGDILLVYRLQRGDAGCSGFRYEVQSELLAAQLRLRRALFRSGDREHGGDAPGRPPVAVGRQTPYPSWIDRSDRPQSVELHPPFRRELGHCFIQDALVTCEVPDTIEAPRASRFELLEDELPLAPAHSMHQDIRDLGRGRYSHWYDSLYFATRDNSDPNRNGRKYCLRLRSS
jgi:SAM-dependent methyltransferase